MRLPGWTFVETLLSVAIVFTLSATVGVVGSRHLESARDTAATLQIRTFELALEQYAFDCGDYPTEPQGLDALWKPPHLAPVPSGWSGPYLRGPVPNDPWGHPYTYRVPGPDGLPYAVLKEDHR